MADNFEDDIRAPDPIAVDRLLDDGDFNDNPPATEADLERIIQQSIREFDFIQEQKEQRNIAMLIEQEKKERLNKFVSMKQQLNKMCLIDKQNFNIYSLCLTAIELYESGILTIYNVSEDECTNIFKIIKTIRVPQEEIDNLKNLIKV